MDRNSTLCTTDKRCLHITTQHAVTHYLLTTRYTLHATHYTLAQNNSSCNNSAQTNYKLDQFDGSHGRDRRYAWRTRRAQPQVAASRGPPDTHTSQTWYKSC